MNNQAREKLIVALDVETAGEARRLLAALRGLAGMFKIGSQLFTAAGPSIVREIVAMGERVFLDLKFHDIPNTVAGACVEATRLGVSLFNAHALGGSEMMRRAAAATRETAAREGLPRPRLIAVTILTSAEAATLVEVGLMEKPGDLVFRLARLADECGLDGVVASPREVARLRAAIPRADFLLVTPGVRPTDAAHDDQRRVMTPAEAVSAGASYLVVGRAITAAPDPARSAQAIIAEMERAESESGRSR